MPSVTARTPRAAPALGSRSCSELEHALGQARLERHPVDSRTVTIDRSRDRLERGRVGHRPQPQEVAEQRRRPDLREPSSFGQRVLAHADAALARGCRGARALSGSSLRRPCPRGRRGRGSTPRTGRGSSSRIAAQPPAVARQRLVERDVRRYPRRRRRTPRRDSAQDRSGPDRPARRRRARPPAGCHRTGRRHRHGAAAATPARSSELLPTPLGPYITVKRDVSRFAMTRSRSARRPKNRSASSSPKGLRPEVRRGPAAAADVHAA